MKVCYQGFKIKLDLNFLNCTCSHRTCTVPEQVPFLIVTVLYGQFVLENFVVGNYLVGFIMG